MENSLLAMASLFATSNSVYMYGMPKKSSHNFIEDDKANIKGISTVSKDERMKRKGLKKFCMDDGKSVWALNEKSAIKKWNKLNK